MSGKSQNNSDEFYKNKVKELNIKIEFRTNVLFLLRNN